ncbi:PatB family C-S lyase [Rouxiella badensis]|uniref:cysteine-S-conjugate beta-lyase n=1 Tax=Rouxiella badensis TaxID=1646377 RepID=A0A1X0WC88_9GAMM|nr:PatB family C-S lyase [Rouxiella badensis]ORJ24382.1 aspartate aminotransferase [Rouxiella badensis]WAT04222.1 PatB family C-S lyase [Rouxiella badensis]
MTFNFDQWVDRSHSDSVKWNKYRDADVIPLWVADTDFLSPPAVINALQKRVAEGVFGYGSPPKELVELMVERLRERYEWTIQPEWIVWLPGLVCGLNLAVRAFTTTQQTSIMPSPIYPPFMQAAQSEGREFRHVHARVHHQRWITDFNEAESTLTGSEKLLLLCNPYNPGGTVYRREELLAQQEFARRHDLLVCSDEIHCDLILEPGLRHIPFASLNEDAANRSVTLMAPSKTFNLAGLGASLAVIPNRELRVKFARTGHGIVPHVNILAYVAATAAYQDGDDWLKAQLDYLRANRDLAFERINAMPGLKMLPIEGTYLGWIDASQAQLESPYRFFLKAGVGLSDGREFGNANFVRINLGCQRALLEKALDRMDAALAAR